MSIFLFILGLIIGFSGKLGADEYHKYLQHQEQTKKEMEDVLIKFKALELNKTISQKG